MSEFGDSLEAILESDEDLAMMYLTERGMGKLRPMSKHEEVEMLLENYDAQIEDILNRIEELDGKITSTQEFLNISLDSVRNRMMRLDIMLSMAAFALAVGTLIAGIFGMNLLSHFEEGKYACKYFSCIFDDFIVYVVSTFIFSSTVVVFMMILRHSRSLGIFLKHVRVRDAINRSPTEFAQTATNNLHPSQQGFLSKVWDKAKDVSKLVK